MSQIKLEKVLREFKLKPFTDGTHQNLVFDAQIWDETNGTSRFVRLIEDSLEAYADTCILDGDGNVLGSGEDPRPFRWRDSHCISVQTYSHDHGSVNKVFICNEDRWITIITPLGLPVGKNWTPFVVNGELHFIHGFSPFRVLKARFVSPKDNTMLVDVVAEHPLNGETSFDGFSRYRGGTAALQLGDLFFGIGHTNLRTSTKVEASTIHRPFLFVYQPDVSVTLFECDFEFAERFNIVDPTSLYVQNGRFYFVTCETETVWHVTPQEGRSCLYSVEIPKSLDVDSLCFGGRQLHQWSSDQPERIWHRLRLFRWKEHSFAEVMTISNL